MKISNAKKYFFLNLLSILGYFSFFILLLWIFYFYPEIKQLDETFIDGGMEYAIKIMIYTGYYYFFQIIFSLILIALTFVEKFLKNKNFKFPSPILENHKFLFWIGVFFVFVPFYILIIYYLIAPLFSFVVDNL